MNDDFFKEAQTFRSANETSDEFQPSSEEITCRSENYDKESELSNISSEKNTEHDLQDSEDPDNEMRKCIQCDQYFEREPKNTKKVEEHLTCKKCRDSTRIYLTKDLDRLRFRKSQIHEDILKYYKKRNRLNVEDESENQNQKTKYKVNAKKAEKLASICSNARFLASRAFKQDVVVICYLPESCTLKINGSKSLAKLLLEMKLEDKVKELYSQPDVIKKRDKEKPLQTRTELGGKTDREIMDALDKEYVDISTSTVTEEEFETMTKESRLGAVKLLENMCRADLLRQDKGLCREITVKQFRIFVS